MMSGVYGRMFEAAASSPFHATVSGQHGYFKRALPYGSDLIMVIHSSVYHLNLTTNPKIYITYRKSRSTSINLEL